MRGAVAVGVVLAAVLFNPYSLVALTAVTCLTLPVVWYIGLPIAFLASTYRDVMRDD